MHYKKDCRLKSVDKGKGFNDVTSTKGNTSLEEGGDVYLSSSRTHENHMNPHME
jgi:hypothetical protein